MTPIKNMLQDMARPVPPNLLLPIPEAPPKGRGAPAKAAKKPVRVKRASNESGDEFQGELNTFDVREHSKQMGNRVAGATQAPMGTKLAPASTMVSLGGMGDKMARMASICSRRWASTCSRAAVAAARLTRTRRRCTRTAGPSGCS